MVGDQGSFLRALSGETVRPSPMWMMRQAGRYLPEYRAVRAKAGGFLDLCFTPELATEVTLQPIRRFGFDAAILFSDILVIPWALGQPLKFVEGEGPRLEPIDTPAAFEALNEEGFLERLAPVFEAIRRIKAALGPETPLIGFAGAPWTLATYMIAGRGTPDQAPAKALAAQDPALFEAYMQLLSRCVARFLAAQQRAGVDALKIFDSWAGSAAGPLQETAVIAPTAAAMAALRQEAPTTPVIAFPRGVDAGLEAYVAAVRPDGLALGQEKSLSAVRERLASTESAMITLQGALDPALLTGPSEPLSEALTAMARETAEIGPHIFNLGHGITPDASIERVEQMMREWRSAFA